MYVRFRRYVTSKNDCSPFLTFGVCPFDFSKDVLVQAIHVNTIGRNVFVKIYILLGLGGVSHIRIAASFSINLELHPFN